MDSALTPREIQSRVRAGASLDEVARLAGVPPERIAPFAEPVLAERDHVAGIALSSTVRSHGEATASRTLGETIAARLEAQGVDPESVEWDTWRLPNRRWVLHAVWSSEGTTDQGGTDDAVEASFDVDPTADADESTEAEDTLTVAEFHFDLMARFSVPVNPWARWLVGDGPNPDAREDSDELALVRALGDDESGDASGSEPQNTGSDHSPAPQSDAPSVPIPEPGTSQPAPALESSHSMVTPQEIGEEIEAEMDRAMALAPGGSSNLDVLYEMLGGIAEDSVNIYEQLDPDAAQRSRSGERRSIGDDVDDTTSFTDEATERLAEELRQLRSRPETRRSDTKLPAPTESTGDDGSSDDAATDDTAADDVAADEQTTATTKRPRTRAERRLEEPEQPSLVDDSTKPKSKRRKRRAQVPSWDEIMFGSPPKRED